MCGAICKKMVSIMTFTLKASRTVCAYLRASTIILHTLIEICHKIMNVPHFKIIPVHPLPSLVTLNPDLQEQL